MLTIHMKCDKCGGSLEDGYEIREFGRDAEGYADEEIVCAVCIESEKQATQEGSMKEKERRSYRTVKMATEFFISCLQQGYSPALIQNGEGWIVTVWA